MRMLIPTGREAVTVHQLVQRPCGLAGLEGAKGTAWESLAASEKIAVACAFIQEEDGLLALKFLARVMASFGGSQGDCLSWHTLTRALDVQH